MATTHTTDMERMMLWATFNNDYGNNGQWSFAVIDASRIPVQQAKGVLSSLVKKGLVTVEDMEGNGRADDMAVFRTPEGNGVCAKLGIGEFTDRPKPTEPTKPTPAQTVTVPKAGEDGVVGVVLAAALTDEGLVTVEQMVYAYNGCPYGVFIAGKAHSYHKALSKAAKAAGL